MLNKQVRFKYCQEDVVIPCQKNEIMRDIIDRYKKQSKISTDKLNFLYGDNKINPDQTLDQVNDKNEEILVLVYLNKNEKNENKTKKSDYIKCDQCPIPAIVEFTNDYKINLLDGNHNTQKIKLQDYTNTQMVDQSEIKCSKCSNSKTEKDKFYYCFECDKNFCDKCQSSHKEHKYIIDYLLKYYKCSQHQGENFISYCLNCKKNLCSFCINQHKEHNLINFTDLHQEQNKECIERIQKIKKIVDDIIDSLEKFKNNLNVYVQINEKLNENLLNMNVNYEILKSMKNLKEMSFLKKDIDHILNTENINEKFQKIMSIYDVMNGKIPKIIENNNEITIKIKIEQNEVNQTIYFLDNTDGTYYESGNGDVNHNHDNLNEINENNATLIINEEEVPFKKYFIPKRDGIHSIKLLFNNKLTDCKYMFCRCWNIIEIDFSKFNTENVTDMQWMFGNCYGLKSLNLESFNTKNVTNMSYMFGGESEKGCTSLTTLNITSFNTEKVIYMYCMFADCKSLTSLNLDSFNTQNVTSMRSMFNGCSSLTKLNLNSFNTQKVNAMRSMFNGCSSLTTLNLSTFNTEKVNSMLQMFYGCKLLKSLDLSSFNTKNVSNMRSMFNGCSSLSILKLSTFNTEKVTNMCWMFENCSSLTTIDLSSFNTEKVTNMCKMFGNCSSLKTVNLSSFNADNAKITGMFDGCQNLLSCNCRDNNIKNEFKEAKNCICF